MILRLTKTQILNNMDIDKRTVLPQECFVIVEFLLNHCLSMCFRHPVDPDTDGAHDYSRIIKTPMDLTTVKEKMNSNTYDGIKQWEDDVKLIWENALLYNNKGTHYYYVAEKLQKIFFKKLEQLYSPPEIYWVSKIGKQLKRVISAMEENP